MLMSRTVVRPVEMQMKTMLIAALALAAAVMAARAFSELPREALVGSKISAPLQTQFVDDGY
jgi:hypothetical protein